MPMSVLQIRIEEDLKKQVSDLFESLGMDIPTAVRIFFKRALVENGIPFEVKGTPPTYKGHDLLYYLNEAQEVRPYKDPDIPRTPHAGRAGLSATVR